MSNHRPHFPITTLTYNDSLIVAAGLKYPAVAARLPASYLTDTAALLAKIPDDVSGQKIKKGETGNLTMAQKANLDTLLHYMNQARKTAKLAFPGGQIVKLHQEFQIGEHKSNDLGAVLGRADIILASVQTTANLTALKLKGWTDAETTAFTTVRGTFPASTQTQQSGQSDAKKATGVKLSLIHI